MIRFEALESLGVRAAAMSDRTDGDCRLPGDSNAFAGGDARRRFLGSLGLDAEHLVCMRQVHGVAVTAVNRSHRGRGGLDAATAPADSDAIITSEPGLPIGVSIADCVPLLLFDLRTGAIGVAHAGRMGTMGNIAAHVVDALAAEYSSRPEDLHAVIGPSAGPDLYEVSEEIAEEFEALSLPRRGRLLDLWAANRLQLERAGVPASQVHVSELCTIRDSRFYSHRADASGARNLAVIAL